MALRENERRILSEIARRLSAEAPGLARQLSSFTPEGGPPETSEPPEPQQHTRWWPWVVCGLAAALVSTVLVVLLTISAPGDGGSGDAESSTVPDPAPGGP